jgi:hypothetical protein
MKAFRSCLTGLLLATGLIIGLHFLHAQDVATFTQAGAASLTDTNVDWDSLSDLEVELKTIEAMPTVSAATLSNQDLEYASFYSAQHLSDWPPLPADVLGLPVWEVDTNLILIDDVHYNYAAAQTRPTTSSSGVQPLNAAGEAFSPDFSFPTNEFWLQINGVSYGLAYLTLHGTTNGVEYEILSQAALSNAPMSSWNSEGMFWGSATTNWTTTTVAQNGRTNLFMAARSRADNTGTGIPDWWWLLYFGQTTNVNPYADPAGDGWNNLEKFQFGMNPNQFYTPPTPQGVTVSYNANNGMVTVSWLPSPGPVTGYTVNMNGTNYNVSSNSLSFENAVSSNDPFSDPSSYGPSIFEDFQVQADYAGGNSPWSAQVPLEINTSFGYDSMPAYLIPGPQGLAYLAIPQIPAGTATLRVTRIDEYAEQSFGDSSFDTNFNISVSAGTNGLYVLPTFWSATSVVDGYGQSDYYWWVQAVDANGSPDWATFLGNGYNDDASAYYSDYYTQTGVWPVTPYFDGREQIKQNLIFLLRAGLHGQPFQFTELYTNGLGQIPFAYPTNYAFASFYELINVPGYPPTAGVGVFLPFGENFLYQNFVFNLSGVNSSGLLTSFANLFTSSDYGLGINEPPTHQFQPPTTSGTVIAPVLATNQTRWLYSYVLPASGPQGYTINSPIGIIQNGLTNQMAINIQNTFGLTFLSTEITYASGGGFGTNTLFPGNKTTQGGYFYSETAQPQFQTVEYDFWNPPYWPYYDTNLMSLLPGMPGFAPTNKSQLLIANVGEQYFRVAGYAKIAIQNGYSGIYAYLGQYFTNAYEISTNGVVTTNSAGVLSPYGDFFPTVPGPAALVTMSDVDTGQRGTGTVYVISLALDANHDGVMDTSFGGPDSTSQANPMEFWVNNNFDRTNYDAADNTFYEDDIGPADVAYLPTHQQVPDCNYTDYYSHRMIPTERDLEDFTRLWVCGITSNLLAALPAGSTITLNWGDVGSPNSANPTIDLFVAADANGGIGYLTNETIAAQQTNITQCPYVGRLAPGGSIQLYGSQFTGGTAHFIWCGVSNGVGQLNLTISDGSGNILAQASQWIQIEDIKNLYERWTVGDSPKVVPTNTAQIAANDLPDSMQLPFRYATNTIANTPYILFVHGWNLEPWEKDRWAETAFKRLYWQGYQGRFGEFRWPTGYGFSGIISAITDADNYDNSEFNAWIAGFGLFDKLNDLNRQYPGNVYLMSHSMGNVVAGEALRIAGTSRIVNTYIAMQGAVPSHCYDPLTSTRIIPPPFDSGTPNSYAYYWTNGAPCYFNGSAGAGTYVNFFNTNDYALSYWQDDQNLKPDTGYSYNISGNKFYAEGIEVDFPSATYQIFAFCDEARCYALGAQANVGGPFKVGQNYQQVELDAPPFDFGPQHLYHSVEFRLDNGQNSLFWGELLSEMKLK